MPDQILSKISWTLNGAVACVLLKSGASGSGEEGGDGVLIHVEDPEAVTPVARETLDGAWMIWIFFFFFLIKLIGPQVTNDELWFFDVMWEW